MKVEAAPLIEAFKHVDNIPQSTVLDTSQYVLVEVKGGKLRLNLSGIAAAQAEIPCTGDIRFKVDRRALGAFLNRVGESVSIDKTAKGVLLKSGTAKLEFAEPSTAIVKNYIEWKAGPGKKAKLDSGLLGMLCGYAPSTPSEVYSEIICLAKGYGSCATNGLVIAACLDKSVETDCLLPKFVCNLASKLDDPEFWVEKTSVSLRRSGAWLHQPMMVSKDPYPIEPIKAALDNVRKQAGFLTISPGVLLTTLRHLKSYSWASSVSPIQCEVSKSTLLLRIDAPTLKTEYSVDIKAIGKAPELWTWPLTPLLLWLAYVDKGEGVQVTAGLHEGTRWFRCKEGEKTHILIAAGGVD